jgi:hypothetical protein
MNPNPLLNDPRVALSPPLNSVVSPRYDADTDSYLGKLHHWKVAWPTSTFDLFCMSDDELVLLGLFIESDLSVIFNE